MSAPVNRNLQETGQVFDPTAEPQLFENSVDSQETPDGLTEGEENVNSAEPDGDSEVETWEQPSEEQNEQTGGEMLLDEQVQDVEEEIFSDTFSEAGVAQGDVEELFADA